MMNNLDKIYSSNIKNFSKEYLEYLSSIFKNINNEDIESFIKLIISKRNNNKNIFFIGNGGSASTASHFANDISIGTRSFKKPFKAYSLCDNQAILTAIGNDYGFEKIFVNQLKNYAQREDLVIAISASGNSTNLVEAINYSNQNNIDTFSLTAFDGGKLKELTNGNIHVPTELKEYGPAEDVHMIIAGMTGSYLIRYVQAES